MIDRSHPLSVKRQAELLNISRGAVYYLPRPSSQRDLVLMDAIACGGLHGAHGQLLF
jgi:putative transposase